MIDMEITKFYYKILQKDKYLILEELKSDYPLALKALAQASIKQFKEAELSLSQIYPDGLKLEEKKYYLEAKLLVSQHLKDYLTMQNIFSKLIQEFPDSFFGNLVQKEVYKRSKQWRSSYEHLLKCIAYLPENETFHFESSALALRFKDIALFSYHRKIVQSKIKKFLLTLESKLIFKILGFIVFFCLAYFLKTPILVFFYYWVIVLLWFYFRSRYILIYQDILLRAISASLVASLLKSVVWSNIF